MDFDEYDYNRYGSGSGSNLDLSANMVSSTTTTDISGAKCKNKKGSTLLSFF
jgi:hypothetical protein